MAAKDVRKNLNLFVDGQGMAGQIDEFNAPKLTLLTEEIRAGGMDGAVDVGTGMEKLTSDFSLFQYAKGVLALFGLAQGDSRTFIARELLESHDGTKTAVAHTMRGKIVELDPGTSKAGTIAPIKFALSLDYYKLTHGGTVIHEIDMVNMVRIVNGVDVLAADRAALGI